MSYNIDTWRTKRIQDLSIPLDALEYSAEYKRRGWDVSKTHKPTSEGFITIAHLGEDGGIVGKIVGDRLLVSAIKLQGEGSGTDYHEILLPALALSTGEFEAVLVWEGGESINRLIVKNGKVVEEEVEL